MTFLTSVHIFLTEQLLDIKFHNLNYNSELKKSYKVTTSDAIKATLPHIFGFPVSKDARHFLRSHPMLYVSPNLIQ